MTLKYTLTSPKTLDLNGLEKFCADARKLEIPGGTIVEHVVLGTSGYCDRTVRGIQLTYNTET